MRYGCIALLRTGLVGMMVTARIALGADSQFDIDGTHTTKEITTTTKESEITRFTFVSPVHAAEDRSYHVQAVVQFLHGGKATGEALPQDFECEGLVWTTPRFDCSNSHIFWGTIFMLRDQQTTGDWVFPYNSYTWLTKFTGRPCGGSGGAPDYWEFYAQQYTMAVTMSVDSNNDGPINDDDIPDKRNPPGVIFTVNNGDVNEDGIPDMEQVALTRAFTEMRVQLHGQIEPEDLMLRFLYQGATAGSMPEGTDPAIRIWKTNGTYPNRSHSDYLEPELWYHVDEQLGFVGPISEQTFFMEGVKPGSQTITVELAYNNQTSAVNFQPGQQDEVAVDEVEVTAVLVEIIDAVGDPVDALSIGLWENAFENPTTSPVLKTDFIDLDPRRFYVRVTGFSEDPGNLVSLRLETESPDPVYAQEEVVVPLAWTDGHLISESLLLVSDQVDQSEEPGRTILCMLGSTVRIAIDINAITAHHGSALVPLESIRDDITLRPYLVEFKKDGDYHMPVTGPQIAEQLRVVTEVYAQAAVQFDISEWLYFQQPDFPWDEWETDAWKFSYNKPELVTRLSAEIKSILDNAAPHKQPIGIFFVTTLWHATGIWDSSSGRWIYARIGGFAATPSGLHPDDVPYANHAFVAEKESSNAVGPVPHVTAHELGHILTNKGGHEPEATNLMYAGGTYNYAATDAKRLKQCQVDKINPTSGGQQ